MGFRQKLIDFFDMPADATEDLPRIVLSADQLVTVCGRHRLIACEENRVIFATLCGRMCVLGSDLVIASIAQGETSISGKITQIGYLESGM